MRVLALICAFSILAVAAVRAEYNPATGEDDMVFITDEKEVQMGKSLAKKVEEKFGLASDAGIQKRVREIGRRIADVCDRPGLTYSFVALEGEELEEDQRYNAFAIPGGYVFIFRTMAEDIESDDELAAVLAHEAGHVAAKHGIKKLQNSIGLTALGLIGATAKTDRQTQVKSSVAITELMMSYSRQAEFEADKLSIKYLKDAGFDPNGAPVFMDKMLKRHLKDEIRAYHYFRTHPYASERRAMLNKYIEGKYDFDDYINTSSEAEQMFK